MTICKFFHEGKCKFGRDCRFEHPQTQPNRFAPLQNQGSGTRTGRSGALTGSDRPEPFSVTADGIRLDLSNKSGEQGDRPIWPFSAYAPGRDAPRQLMEGPLEQSPEEMRVQYYLARAAGQAQEYAQKEEALLAQVNQQIQQILGNAEEAKKYVQAGAKEHPNRNDQCHAEPRGATITVAARPNSAFGQPSSFAAPAASTGGGGFGQPSALGGPRPAFATPSAPGQTSAFGAPSSLGAAGGFGKPSALGGAGGGGSAFGQASGLGQNKPFGGAQKPAAFGQVSQPGASGGFANSSQPAFGQTSSFGTGASKPPFGAPTQPAAFGQTSKPTQPAFGQASQPAKSAFGQVSQPTQSAFGNHSQQTPFGTQPQQQPQTGGSTFGSATPFGTAATKPSPFGAPTTSQPFGTTAAKPNPFAANQPSSTFGSKQPLLWNGQPIVKDPDGNPCTAKPDPRPHDPNHKDYTRIWFPEGPPAITNLHNPAALKDTEAPAEVYEGDFAEMLKALYETSMEDGEWKDGIMPEVPPMREWTKWDV